jgi:pSer/pThr/pTyr-binding forkhead associated (FHA) protein
MVRDPRRRSVPPPGDEAVASGEVALSADTRKRLPTLTDEGELAAGEAEDTEKDPESARQVFASTPLPGDVEADLVESERSHPLSRIRTLIGRGPDADILLNDRKASRRHASIFYSGREFRIRDEGSANGTLLNGSKVIEYVIRDGDEVVIGSTVMRFRIR